MVRRAVAEALESRTLLSSVSGIAFADLNSDGTQNSNERGLAGCVVFDDIHGTGAYQSDDPASPTDANGLFTLTLPFGQNGNTVVIGVLPPTGGTGLQPTSPSAGLQSVYVADDSQIITGVNFGFLQYGNVGGTVFQDNNNNGSQDYGDTGLSNCTVYYDPTGQGYSYSDIQCNTAYDGTYLLYNVPDTGAASIHVLVPSGWQQTSPSGGAAVNFTGAVNFGAYNAAEVAAASQAPTGLAASASGGGIVLTWNNNAGTFPAVTVERSTDGGASFSTIASLTGAPGSFTDTAVTPGAEYTYEVIDQSTGSPSITSPPSAPATIWTQPLSPYNLTASVGYGNAVSLSWSGGAAGEYGAGNSQIISYTDSSFSTQYIKVASAADQCTVRGLADDTTYTFAVSNAINANSDNNPVASAPSNSASATTGPYAPTGLSYSIASPGEVDLSWSMASEPSSVVIDRWQGPSGLFTSTVLMPSPSAPTSYADTNLPAGDGALTYYVYATYDGLQSDAPGSNYLTITRAPAPYAIGVGQTIEEDLPLGGVATPGDSLSVGGYNPADMSVAWVGGSNVVDANGMAELLVTGLAVGDGNLYVANASGTPLITVPQLIAAPTLSVTSLTPESDAADPTATTATKGGADGRLLFSLTNPDGSAALAFADMPINYAPSSPASYGLNYTVGAATIAAGFSSVEVPVHAVDDGLVDPTLAGAVTLENSSDGQYTIGANSSANFEILDGGVHVHSISLSSDLTLAVGDSQTLMATITGNLTAAEAIAFSYDASLVSVVQSTPAFSGGVETIAVTVTALSTGDTDISAADAPGNHSGSRQITVNPPAAPDGLSLSAVSSGEIDLAWTSHSAPSTIFQIVRDGVVIGQTAAGATTYHDTTVSEATGYTYSVIATVNGIASSASTSAYTITPLAAPSGLTAMAISTSEIDLRWTNASQATNSFMVYRSTDGESFSPLTDTPVSGAAYADTTATEGRHYWYEVMAVPPPATSLFASAFSAVADSWSLPSAPSGLVSTEVDANRVNLSWTNNSQGASFFYIERLEPGSNFYAILDPVDAVPGVNTDSDWSVVGNSAYQYVVLAATPDGNVSALSDGATTNVTTPTAGVIGVSATEISATEIDLSWTLNDADATEVDVYRWTDGTAPVLVAGAPLDASTTPFADTGIAPDTHYYYKVCAVDPTNGASGFSVVDAYTLPNAASGLNVTANSAGTEADATWTNNGGADTVFEIDRLDPGATDYNAIDDTAPGATSYADNTVSDGNYYSYRVQALSGDGGTSIPDVGATNAAIYIPLNVPSGLTATANGTGEIDLAWMNNSQNNTGYTVERSDSATGVYAPIGIAGYPDLSTVEDPAQTWYSDTGLLAATRYYYRVRATLDSGTTSQPSEPSAYATAATAGTLSVTFVPGVPDPTNPDGTPEGEPVTLVLNDTFAPGTPDPAASGVKVDWGDGETDDEGAGAGSYSHTYDDMGDYAITLTTKDSSYTGYATAIIHQANSALSIVGANNASATAAYQLTATFAHPVAHGALHWYVDWGDGAFASMTGPAGSSGGEAEGGESDSTVDTQAFSHTYPATGIVYKITVSAESDQGLWQEESTVTAATPNPAYADDIFIAGPIFIGYPTGGIAGGTGADAGETTFDDPDAPAGSSEAPGYFPEHYVIDFGNGDSSSVDASGLYGPPSGSATETYQHAGKYLVSVTGSDGDNGASEVDVVNPPAPTLTAPDPEIVDAGQAVDISATYSGMPPGITPVAFVDWGDGTGKHPATVTGGSSGTISAHLDHEPTAGIHGAGIIIYNPYEKYPYYYGPNSLLDSTKGWPITAANTSKTIYVWGAVLGDGRNTDVLGAGPAGMEYGNYLYLYLPAPGGEAFDVTITTSDAADDDLWLKDSASPTGTPLIGGATSSYTFTTSQSGWQAWPGGTFSVTATAGNTTYDCLSYTFTAAVDTAASSSDAGGFLPAPGAATSNKASDIGLKFETETDEYGNPIVTDNNPDSPAPGATSGSSSDSTDPLPPVASLVKVDLVYPSSGPILYPITLTTYGQYFTPLRFWSSASEGSLVVGGPTLRVDFGTTAPTTLYAEMSGGLYPEGGYSHATFTYNSDDDMVSPVAVSLSVDKLPSADPTAMIHSTEFPPTGSTAPQYTVLNVGTPYNLPPGATVSVSVSSDVVNDLDVYDDVPSSGRTPIIGRDASGEAAFCDWTVGSNGVGAPSKLYVVGLSGTDYDQVKFTLSISMPGQPANLITATQAATVPGKGGYLIAFDGTLQSADRQGQLIPGTQPSDPLRITANDDVLQFQKDSIEPKKKYYNGTGYSNNLLGQLVAGPSLAYGGPQSAAMVGNAYDVLDKFYADPKNRGVPVDVVAWSRGCFEASKLLNELAEGFSDLHGFVPTLRFAGLISPVSRMGPPLLNLDAGPWPTALPAGLKTLYEARDSNPDDTIFGETAITAAPGTNFPTINPYAYPHQTIGWQQQVLTDMENAARAAGVPFPP